MRRKLMDTGRFVAVALVVTMSVTNVAAASESGGGETSSYTDTLKKPSGSKVSTPKQKREFVPFGRIPILGRLFRLREEERSTRNTIIIVKPRIAASEP